MPSLTEALLTAMEQSSETLYRIAKDTGVDYAAVHGFYNGNRDIALATADKLAEHLKLELRPVRRDAK